MINGIPVYAPTIAPAYFIPTLQTKMAMTGPAQPLVLHTLTYSPRAVALAVGSSNHVPGSWRWVSYGGFRLAVPPSWVHKRLRRAPGCANDIVLSEPGVVLAKAPTLPFSCPISRAELQPVPQVAGIEVDDFTTGFNGSRCVGPRSINGVRLCIGSEPRSGVLIARVTPAAQHSVTIKLGMFGDGKVDRTILDSITPIR